MVERSGPIHNGSATTRQLRRGPTFGQRRHRSGIPVGRQDELADALRDLDPLDVGQRKLAAVQRAKAVFSGWVEVAKPPLLGQQGFDEAPTVVTLAQLVHRVPYEKQA